MYDILPPKSGVPEKEAYKSNVLGRVYAKVERKAMFAGAEGVYPYGLVRV
jgi:hypothetical protein